MWNQVRGGAYLCWGCFYFFPFWFFIDFFVERESCKVSSFCGSLRLIFPLYTHGVNQNYFHNKYQWAYSGSLSKTTLEAVSHGHDSSLLAHWEKGKETFKFNTCIHLHPWYSYVLCCTSILYVNQSMKYWLLIDTTILIYDLHFDLPLWKAIII